MLKFLHEPKYPKPWRAHCILVYYPQLCRVFSSNSGIKHPLSTKDYAIPTKIPCIVGGLESSPGRPYLEVQGHYSPVMIDLGCIYCVIGTSVIGL